MKKKITRAEYLQLIGLLALAENYSRRMIEVQKSVAELLQINEESSEHGHVSDVIWDDGSRDADLVLRKLKIEVGSRKR